jgi:hypothetical protein
MQHRVAPLRIRRARPCRKSPSPTLARVLNVGGMKARMSAKDLVARLHVLRLPRPTGKSVDQLSEDERLRVTRFVLRHATGHDHEQPDTGAAWTLEVYGFGSGMPLACQQVELPTDRAEQPEALDSVLASLSLVRWGACVADPEGTRIEGCCVQEFAEAPQRTLSARHAA